MALYKLYSVGSSDECKPVKLMRLENLEIPLFKMLKFGGRGATQQTGCNNEQCSIETTIDEKRDIMLVCKVSRKANANPENGHTSLRIKSNSKRLLAML